MFAYCVMLKTFRVESEVIVYSVAQIYPAGIYIYAYRVDRVRPPLRLPRCTPSSEPIV